MATIAQAMNEAFREWFEGGLELTKGVIKERWLEGPRPQRLGVVSGNLKNRIKGKVLQDGFAVGTAVKYGVYWEKGIKAHVVRAGPGKALPIALASTVKVGTRWGQKLQRATGLTKIVGGGKTRRNAGNLVIFRKSARIPAQAPRKFLEPGAREALPEVIKLGGFLTQVAINKSFMNRTVGVK